MNVVAETGEHIGRCCTVDVHGGGHGPAVTDAQVVSKLKVSDVPGRTEYRKNGTGSGSNTLINAHGIVEEMNASGIKSIDTEIRAGACRYVYRIVLNGHHCRRRRTEGIEENTVTSVGTLQANSIPTDHGPAKRNGPRTLQNNSSLRKC